MRVCCLIVASLLLLPTGCSERPAPNVVVYLIDSLRADHLGVYGYERPTSPVIDELSEKGVLFERAYSSDTRTLGAIPSLLTSRHVPSHGVKRFGDAIADDVTTLAEVLAGQGYDTASFITNVNAGAMSKLDRGFAYFHDAIKTHRDPDALRSFPEEAFFEWLDRERDGPFFAYVHTAEPHRPYTPPPPFDRMFDSDYDGTTVGRFEGPNGYGSAESPEDIAHVIALYDGEVRFADQAVGQLIAGLAKRGLDDDTVIVVTADHGEELYDRGSWNHGHSLYDELLRVPLVIAGTTRVDRGRRISEPVQLVDVAPTILGILGLPVPSQFEGENLTPLMKGKDREHFRRRSVFAMATLPPLKAAVIQGPYKCIFTEPGTLELYHLLADPREEQNLTEEKPNTSRALFKEMNSWMDAHSGAAKSPSTRRLSKEEEERLRALGYVE